MIVLALAQIRGDAGRQGSAGDGMTATTKDGEKVRGFTVLLRAPNGKRMLCLPCSGESPYTGEAALQVMRRYAKERPSVKVQALTEAPFSGKELLTLAEMETIFADWTP